MNKWNVVLNKFIEIKKKALEKGVDLWAYNKEEITCLEYWVSELEDKKYEELIHYLELNEYGELLLLRYANYSDIMSGEQDVTLESFWNLYDGFYKECRSVVLDIKNECLVLTPFRKFRNLNEAEETSYENISRMIKNASCVEVSNKLDGSMQAARFYNNEIIMSGSQALDKENSWRLADGYKMLMENRDYQIMLMENPDKTFIFEYISRRDAHVVKYDVEGLFLIGVRDVNNGYESSYREILEYGSRYGVLTTEVYDKTLDEIIAELDSKKSCEAEGFVLNVDGFKVKVKYNDYVYMHKVLSSISSINVIIKSIAEEKFDDLIAKVPNAYKDRVIKVAQVVFKYVEKQKQRIHYSYKMAPKEDKKQFMIWVTENVDKDIQGYVRNEYYSKSYNVLKKSTGYLKLKDMGIEDYKEFFEV